LQHRPAQFQVCLVDQRRRLQRITGADAMAFATREPLQFDFSWLFVARFDGRCAN